MKTFQLRRYELEPQLAKGFVEWASETIFPLRESFGFKVEWSYFDDTNSELVWLASANCDRAEFESLSNAWEASGMRAKGVDLMPPGLIRIHASFVEKV